ncbi:MAG: hypothetical protein JSV86_00995 [Gemmatimonadota bacterium]|nr:MAG: hypothetical protein JSV86_00995 [Gemmatimonadota bacterium]
MPRPICFQTLGYELDHHASIYVLPGYYFSYADDWGDYWKPIRRTETTDIQGKLRVTRTRVNGKGLVVESVTGSGHRPAVEQEGDWRTFSFTAYRYADGTVDGQWERIRRREPGAPKETKSHGVVTCFTIVGNEAWFGGFATKGIYSDPPTNGVRWRVKDNGHAGMAEPDQISLQEVYKYPQAPPWHCATTPDDLELNDIGAGDIHISP